MFTERPCTGIGGAVLKNLYAAGCNEEEAYEQLAEQGVIDAVAAHTAAALWNRTLAWRAGQGGAARAGEAVGGPAGPALVASDDGQHRVQDVCIPVYGTMDDGAADAMPMYYSSFTRDALRSIGVTLPYPITRASAPPGFPLGRDYRRPYINVPGLDWVFSARPLDVAPTTLAGFFTEATPLASTASACLAASSGANAVLRFELPVDASLATVLSALPLS
eukprot:TRINITY_DN2737_c0_g1_i2.p1 TRINITY_DN2737_c0_g1~~TRINITY_DN2737_c0_g1_i2.p1  ORF type:complete len:220 (+),score=53.29 TRINITY_DN2737_c0_g1_i2:645-1304(+)